MVFLESIAGGAAAPVLPDVDERAARRTLRAQIARLERDLGAAVVAAYPRLPAGTARVSHHGPRLLGLEDARARPRRPRRPPRRRARAGRRPGRAPGGGAAADRAHAARPGAYRWVRVANADIGEPGCKHWHVRPRLGLIGMLAGWWHVKISSGCPLAP